LKKWEKPPTINTDKAPAYGDTIRQLKEEGKCSEDLKYRQIVYPNNRVEADHGKLKRLINPVRGFQSMKTAYATIKGFEVMYIFKKGPFKLWQYGQGLLGEIRLIKNWLLNF
jgi:transposase-like protein